MDRIAEVEMPVPYLARCGAKAGSIRLGRKFLVGWCIQARGS
jgi:hypothetical protein